jgi:hypothetical protein
MSDLVFEDRFTIIEYDTIFSIDDEELPDLSPHPSSKTSRCNAKNGDEEGEIAFECTQRNFEFSKNLKVVCIHCGTGRRSSATKKHVGIRKKRQ